MCDLLVVPSEATFRGRDQKGACEVNRIAAARLRQVAGEELRRAHLMVRVGGEDVAITWATRNEILKFLQRAPGALNVVLYFENVGARRPVDLDHDGKQHLFRALTYWHDHPAIGKPFPDDAQTLLTALAGELEAIAP
jgi:hypothetical protein